MTLIVLTGSLNSKPNFCFRCSMDESLIGNFIKLTENGLYGLCAQLWVFSFHNSPNVFFHCTVKICQPGTAACDYVSMVPHFTLGIRTPALTLTVLVKIWISSFYYLYMYPVWNITKTRLYNSNPLKPPFYKVKLGFTGVYIIFFLLKT